MLELRLNIDQTLKAAIMWWQYHVDKYSVYLKDNKWNVPPRILSMLNFDFATIEF